MVACNVRDVAILVDGLAVFISAQIVSQIYGLAAKYAGYFWGGTAAHQCLLRTVKITVEESSGTRLSRIDRTTLSFC
jgi:hypothetical protein